MARPIKDTVLYFSHDADASNGKTVTILESQFGIAGYAFWFKLLEILADVPGHVIRCSNYNDWQFLLAKTKVDENTGLAIIQKLCDLGALDSCLWKHKMIWSDNFVERLSDVYKNRKREVPQKPLLPVETPQRVELIPVETPQGAELLPVETPQSKVKKSIVNNNTNNHKDDIALIFKTYEDEIGALTPSVSTQVGKWVDTLNSRAGDWVVDAINRAAGQNKRSWAYVNGILKKWEAQGFKDGDAKPSSKEQSTHGDGWQ